MNTETCLYCGKDYPMSSIVEQDNGEFACLNCADDIIHQCRVCGCEISIEDAGVCNDCYSTGRA